MEPNFKTLHSLQCMPFQQKTAAGLLLSLKPLLQLGGRWSFPFYQILWFTSGANSLPQNSEPLPRSNASGGTKINVDWGLEFVKWDFGGRPGIAALNATLTCGCSTAFRCSTSQSICHSVSRWRWWGSGAREDNGVRCTARSRGRDWGQTAIWHCTTEEQICSSTW